jgi:hypothetical protein
MPTVLDRSWSSQHQIQTLQCDIDHLHDFYLDEFNQSQKLEMHLELAGQEVGQLKKQLNLRQEKNEGRKGKQFNSAAEFLMYWNH